MLWSTYPNIYCKETSVCTEAGYRRVYERTLYRKYRRHETGNLLKRDITPVLKRWVFWQLTAFIFSYLFYWNIHSSSLIRNLFLESPWNLLSSSHWLLINLWNFRKVRTVCLHNVISLNSKIWPSLSYNFYRLLELLEQYVQWF